MFNKTWQGIAKLIEESGEVLQILGKIIAYPNGIHPDGKGGLEHRCCEELADLYASMDYFVELNVMEKEFIEERRKEKLEIFRKWGLTGISNGPNSQ